MIGDGAAPGLDNHHLGEKGGQEEYHTLTSLEMGGSHPSSHLKKYPTFSIDELTSARKSLHHSDTETTEEMVNSHNNMQPYIVVKSCIAVVGIFPKRS